MDKYENISIACCLWGDWPANTSKNSCTGIDYVNKLFRGVKRNLTLPFRFFCFTDTPHQDYNLFDSGILVKEIKTPSRVKEIAKLYVYSPDNGLTGRVLVIDLDTVIINSINEFVQRDEKFIVRKAFNERYIIEYNGIGGDLISFDVGFGEHIWHILDKRTAWLINRTKGDERAAYKLLLKDIDITFWQDILPGKYISYKKHVRNAENPLMATLALTEASLVSFHGRPRPHDIINKYNWIKRNWI